jgi:hypothetical protein
MFALAMIAFTLAAAFGIAVFIAAVTLSASLRFRPMGFSILTWGVTGSAAAFILFVLIVQFGEDGREPIFSRFGAAFAAAGFGIVGAAGGLLFLAVRGLRFPNRWADRRRPVPPPNHRWSGRDR